MDSQDETIIITHRLLIRCLSSPKGFVALVCNVEKHKERSRLISEFNKQGHTAFSVLNHIIQDDSTTFIIKCERKP